MSLSLMADSSLLFLFATLKRSMLQLLQSISGTLENRTSITSTGLRVTAF